MPSSTRTRSNVLTYPSVDGNSQIYCTRCALGERCVWHPLDDPFDGELWDFPIISFTKNMLCPADNGKECVNHHWRWTGRMPCTGELACVKCGVVDHERMGRLDKL